MGAPLRKPCEDCGKPMNKQHKPGKPYVCAPCGVARGARHAMALYNHEQWALEPWAAGMARVGITVLAEIEQARAVGDTGPIAAHARLGGRKGKPVGDMRRARETREQAPAGVP